MGCTEQLCEIKKWAIALEKMGVADQMYEFWQRDVALVLKSRIHHFHT